MTLLFLMFGLGGGVTHAWPFGAFQITAGEDGSYHSAEIAEKAAESKAQTACSSRKADQLSPWDITYQQNSDSFIASAEFICSAI